MNEEPRISEIRAVLTEYVSTNDLDAQLDVRRRIRAIVDREPPPETTASAAVVVRDFCAERSEFVSVLKNCTENNADYYRWQGHAEARRQLTERLAGTIDGPGVLS